MSKEPHLSESPDSAVSNRVLIRWVWHDYLKKHWRKVGAALVLMAIEGSMLGALSYIVQPMFDTVFIAGNRGALWWVAGAIAAIFLVRAASDFGHRVLMFGVGLSVITQMQSRMVEHLLTLDSAFFNTNSPGTLIERVRGDTTIANQIWMQVLGTAWRELVTVIALLAVAISVDWRWTLIAVAGVPVLIGPILIMQRYVRKKARAAREGAALLSTRLDEIFHGVNTIKLNNAEAHENRRFGATVEAYFGQEMKARIGGAGIPSTMDVVAAIGFGGVVLFGGAEIIDGKKSVGEFMSFFTAIALLFEPMRRLARVSAAWQTARASLERILKIFDEQPSIQSPPKALALPDDPRAADVRFDDVVVRYQDEPALRGLSFTAKAGEMTAFVGASGAGKSTIFTCLTRLVDASSGEVTVGGVATTQLDLADLRQLFSVVTQDAPMFDESLADNIRLAEQDVSDARIVSALEAANLTDFVAGAPQGLETPAGPRGSQLSGGQRQRVAIARALLRDAPILLLDEATSALDAESEAHVQEALERFSKDRTTLVIAHRLSTIRRADRIVVLDRGRVVDEGSHDELLKRDGVYARLYALQFSED
ncbi:ABC transporter ATP-binding protein/permease [Rhodobacteraceae bacterium]|nr:ABC transporter ATP-binding protein/permease [Paracoccaceae bacterium]